MRGKLVVLGCLIVMTGCSAQMGENLAHWRPGYGEVTYKGDAEFIGAYGAYEVGKMEQAKASPDVKTGYMQLQEKLAGVREKLRAVVAPQGGTHGRN